MTDNDSDRARLLHVHQLLTTALRMSDQLGDDLLAAHISHARTRVADLLQRC